MLRSVVEKVGRFAPKRRLFPSRISDAQALDRAVDKCVMDCLEPAAQFITKQTPLVAAGSCFAQNIAGHLSENGYNVALTAVRDRLFTPPAIQRFAEIVGTPNCTEEVSKNWGAMAVEGIAGVQSAVKIGATVIITFGLSTNWFDKEAGQIVIDPPKGRSPVPDHDRYEMRQMSVGEIVESIAETVNALRAINPFTKIVLTLSPIPLVYSGSDYPVTVADCISKSSLRVALDEFLRLRIKDVYYFPSFEILRWLAPMTDLIWGADNMLSHIRAEWIDYVMAKFKQYYCVGEGPSPLPPNVATRPF